jgi:hypothetical protein
VRGREEAEVARRGKVDIYYLHSGNQVLTNY